MSLFWDEVCDTLLEASTSAHLLAIVGIILTFSLHTFRCQCRIQIVQYCRSCKFAVQFTLNATKCNYTLKGSGHCWSLLLTRY